MCKIIEEYGDMRAEKAIENTVTEMLKGGKLTVEEIAAYSQLSVEEVKAIQNKIDLVN